jgi:hypothetical protein
VTAARLKFPAAIGKLSPIKKVPTATRPRPVPIPPYCAATYVSIRSTCSDACPFKDAGCFAQTGFTRFAVDPLDAANKTSSEAIADECRLIDAATGIDGVDLRLHVSGDVRTDAEAQALAGAARRWRDRDGGTVWTFTHAWRTVRRRAWGAISVLASVETPREARQARQRGYAPAIVVTPALWPADGRAFDFSGIRVIPCPAETRGRTCVECRLCLDRPLHKMNVAIGFVAHGTKKRSIMAAVWGKLLGEGTCSTTRSKQRFSAPSKTTR